MGGWSCRWERFRDDVWNVPDRLAGFNGQSGPPREEGRVRTLRAWGEVARGQRAHLVDVVPSQSKHLLIRGLREIRGSNWPFPIQPGNRSCFDRGFHGMHGWTGLEQMFPARSGPHLAGVRRSKAESLLIRVIRAIRGPNCLFQIQRSKRPDPRMVRRTRVGSRGEPALCGKGVLQR
jgi:hypothetical protein